MSRSEPARRTQVFPTGTSLLTYGGAPPSCPTPPDPSTYSASADFSAIQGCRNWSYLDSTGSVLSFDAGNGFWQGSETYLRIDSDGGHPGNVADAVRRWTAPAAGTIEIKGNAHDGDPGGGDGVTVSIYHGSALLWRHAIVNGDTTGFDFDLMTTVMQNDTIDFSINKNTDNSYDLTAFDPTIVVSPLASQPLPPQGLAAVTE